MTSSLQAYRVSPWFELDGDHTLRLDYPLHENSIVLDVGGYLGDWAAPIYDRYHSTIYVFEPVPEFYHKLVDRFQGNDKIKVYDFGLANYTGDTTFAQLENKSSAFIDAGEAGVKVKMKDIIEFLDENSITHVDLMKINIEGGEYDLLQRVVEAKRLDQFENIQVQFHDFFDDAAERMHRLRESFQHTHYPTYMFDFVWENWQRKRLDDKLYDQMQRYGEICLTLEKNLVQARGELASLRDHAAALETEAIASRTRLAYIDKHPAVRIYRKVKQVLKN